jgi:hypothetical protein
MCRLVQERRHFAALQNGLRPENRQQYPGAAGSDKASGGAFTFAAPREFAVRSRLPMETAQLWGKVWFSLS